VSAAEWGEQFRAKRITKEAWKRVAKRRWRDAEWIEGKGKFAVVVPCRHLTVLPCKTREEAVGHLDFIDRVGCGGRCHMDHWIEELTREWGK